MDACELLQISNFDLSYEEVGNLLSAMGYLNSENINTTLLHKRVFNLLNHSD